MLLTGPRQCGKTTLLKHLYPRTSYVLLEDPDVIARVRTDPRSFMEALRPPVLLDEIQNAPELFNYVRARVDAAPNRKGRWILTGSQESGLMQGLEVDFVLPAGNRRLVLLEAKATATVTPGMATSLGRLGAAVKGHRTRSIVVHAATGPGVAGRALSPGVAAMTVPELLAELA